MRLVLFFLSIMCMCTAASCRCGMSSGSGSGEENHVFEGNWIEAMDDSVQYVQGMCLWPDGKAESIGMATLLYEKWRLVDTCGGRKIILDGKSVGNGLTLDFSDTMDVVSVSEDSLVLERRGYYGETGYRMVFLKKTLNFSGVYKGTVPAADCPGIEVTFAAGEDGTFRITYDYLERDGSFGTQGRYTVWGNTVIAAGDNADSVFFRKEAGSIRMLDRNMQPVTGALEDMYILSVQQ